MAQLITWVMTLVVIRILTPSDYGLVAMASVFIALVAIFADSGLGPAIVQRSEIDTLTLRKAFGTVLVVHFALACLLVLLAPSIAAFYSEERVTAVLRVLSLQLVVAGFGVVPDALLQRNLDFRRRSLLDLSSAIVGGALTLGLALSGQGVWALVAGSLMTQLWRVVGVNIVAPFAHLPRFSASGLRALLAFGGRVTASQLLWVWYSQADILIAGRWLGKELLGVYSVAMHLASLPNQRLGAIVNQIAFPAFSRIQDDKGNVANSLLLGVRVLSFAAFAALWGLSSVAPEVVQVILGPTWEPVVVPLQLLGLIMPLRTIGNFLPTALQGIGRSDIVLRNAVAFAIIGPVAAFVGVQWGLLGLCAAWLVATPVIFVHNLTNSLPALGLDFRQLAKAMVPAAAAGVIMFIAVTMARFMMGADHGILRLVTLIAVGAAGYLIASLVVNRQGLRSSYSLASEILLRR
jgi:O-antigen/teichoic acid export membrane protein